MLHRQNKTIHHYIQQVQKTSSKQIQRKIDGTFKRQQNKAHQISISLLLARKFVSMKTLYEEHNTKTYIYYTCI